MVMRRVDFEGCGEIGERLVQAICPQVYLASQGKCEQVLGIELQNPLQIGDGVVQLVFAGVGMGPQVEGR